MRKKLFTFLLAVMASLGSMFAQSGTCGDNLTWNLTDSTLTITGSGEMAYGTAYWDVPWYNYNSYIKYVSLPDGLTSIGVYAFQSCRSLTSVTIPNSVTSIGNRAFWHCDSLTSLTIGNSIASIGDGAFDGCSNLTTITNFATTPQPLDPDGISVFGGVPLACTLYVPAESIAAYQAADVWKEFGNILAIDDSTEEVNYATLADIYNMAADSTFTLGAFDVMYVPDFQSGSNMYIKDPTGSCVIYEVNYGLQAGDHVEAGLQGKVSIYNGLHEVIPITAKEDLIITHGEAPAPIVATEAPSLNNASQYVVYEDVSFATDTAFVEGRRHAVLGSWNGQTITFYNQYYIGATLSANKTYNITAVNTIYRTTPQAYPLAVEEVSPAPCIIASGTCGAQGDNLTWTLSCDSVLIISGTGAIDNYTAYNSAPWYEYRNAIKSVIIRRGVTSIGDCAFYRCRVLTSVEIPNSVTSIEFDAFRECSCLTSVTIPNSVTSIGLSAFYKCSGLTSVTIPNSVTSIGGSAFEDCTGLTSVTIGNSVTNIGSRAFYGCSSLTSVEIPNSVTSNGSSAFAGCSSLTSINVSNGNANYCSVEGVLFNKDNTVLVQYPGGKNGNYTIPNGVTSIGGFAFHRCSGLASVTIPNSVTSIGYDAFSICSGLTSIEIPNSVTSIETSAFKDCTGLTSVTIPNSVTNIESTAFFGCSSLTSIDIPNSVTSIGEQAFWACTGLTSVTIGYSVTNIESTAFFGCSSLTSIDIPNSVTSIGEGAFWACSGLTSVTNRASIPQSIISNVFEDVNLSSCTLYVPAESVEAYKAADVWKEFENILPIEGDLPVGPTEGEFNVLYVGQDGDSISSEPVMLHLPVAPEIADFTFLKWQVVAGDLENGIIIQAVYQANEYTSAPEVYTNPANPAQKLIRNGNVYILTDDKIYSITGQTVR